MESLCEILVKLHLEQKCIGVTVYLIIIFCNLENRIEAYSDIFFAGNFLLKTGNLPGQRMVSKVCKKSCKFILHSFNFLSQPYLPDSENPLHKLQVGNIIIFMLSTLTVSIRNSFC